MTYPEYQGVIGEHRYRTRTARSSRGIEVGVYCGEERYLAGIILEPYVKKGRPPKNISVEVFTCCRKSEMLLERCVHYEREQVRCDPSVVAEVAKMWAELVLPDTEYSYWRDHRDDPIVSYDEYDKRLPPEEHFLRGEGEAFYCDIRSALRSGEHRRDWKRFPRKRRAEFPVDEHRRSPACTT